MRRLSSSSCPIFSDDGEHLASPWVETCSHSLSPFTGHGSNLAHLREEELGWFCHGAVKFSPSSSHFCRPTNVPNGEKPASHLCLFSFGSAVCVPLLAGQQELTLGCRIQPGWGGIIFHPLPERGTVRDTKRLCASGSKAQSDLDSCSPCSHPPCQAGHTEILCLLGTFGWTPQ